MQFNLIIKSTGIICLMEVLNIYQVLKCGFGMVLVGVFYSFFYIYFSRDQCLHLHPDNEKEVEIIRRWIQMEIANVGSGGVFKTQLNVLNGDFYEANFS